MIFDMETLEAQNLYKILTATVTPLPIALITTLSASGVINAAPFSFFNVMGHEPPTVAIGLLAGSECFKDTAANILDTGEFVVNLVAESNAEAMNITCIDAPPEIDELTLAGLTPAASQAVRPPRIAESPVSFECRVLTSLVTGPRQTAVIGRVVRADVEAHRAQGGTITVIDRAGRRDARLAMITSSIAEAIDAANLILCPAPAFAQAPIAELAAPHLRDGQVVFLPPGTFGSYIFARAARDAGNRAEIATAETGTLPWLARKQGPYAVRISGRGARLPTCVFA